jgi:hypothetical protein
MFFVFSARGVEYCSGIIKLFLLFGRHGILSEEEILHTSISMRRKCEEANGGNKQNEHLLFLIRLNLVDLC